MDLKLLTMDIRYEHDVVLARQRARTIAAFLQFDAQDQTASPLPFRKLPATTFQYGGGGSC